MSEQGYMHRRVQVEVAWFIALSDAGFAEFKPLSPGARTYLLGLVKISPRPMLSAIKEIEKTTNHDVKAVEYWIKSKFEARPELLKASEFVHFACTSEDINNTSHALQLRAGRDLGAAAGAGPYPAEAARNGPQCRRADAQPHPWPDRQPHHGGQGDRQRGDAPADRLRPHRRRQDPGQDERRGGQLQRPPGGLARLSTGRPSARKVVETPEPLGLGLTFQPFSIQIEPHDYMAELFDAVARANTILIDWSRDIWGYVSLGYFKQKLRRARSAPATMPHKVNPIDFENAEGNLGLANALLRHLSEKLPISRWQRDLTDSTVLRNMGVALGYATLAYQSLLTGLNKLELNETRWPPTWTPPGKCWPNRSRP
jgi:adenylosuccinate lyase